VYAVTCSYSTEPMTQQFVVSYRHTLLQETEQTWHLLNIPPRKPVIFLLNYKEKQFSWTHHLDRCVCNPTV